MSRAVMGVGVLIALLTPSVKACEPTVELHVETETPAVILPPLPTLTTETPIAPAITSPIPVEPLDISVRVAPPPPPPPVETIPVPTGLMGLPFAPPWLAGCDEMNFYRIQWGLPEQFSDYPRAGPRSKWGYGWRESNCRNDAPPSIPAARCCVGYWANYISSHLSPASAYRAPIMETCQVFGKWDIYGNAPLQKQKQACVTAIVYGISGLSPWRL